MLLSGEDEASSGTSLRFSQRLFGPSPSPQNPVLQGALLWGRAGQQTPIVAGGQKSLNSLAPTSPEDGQAGTDLAQGGGFPSRPVASQAMLDSGQDDRPVFSMHLTENGCHPSSSFFSQALVFLFL